MSKPQSPTADVNLEPSHYIMEQAAEWYALLASDEVTERDQTRWRIWLDDDSEHRLAWSYVESVSSRFAPIQSTPDPRRTADGLWDAHTRTVQRRRVLTGIVGLVGSGLLGWGTWHHTPLPRMARAWQADHHTAIGETRNVVLTDGTRVWMNTASAFNKTYNRSKRSLYLVAGEILIDTAKDTLSKKSRPFYVETPHGRLQALGTKFTVRYDKDQTLLAVYEGAVNIYNTAGNTMLQAGEQVTFNQNELASVQFAETAREAWSRGVLVAQDIPLSEVVAELRRYRNGHLGLAPEVASLRVFGNFPLADTDNALDMLAAVLPVRINRTLPWWVSIEAQ